MTVEDMEIGTKEDKKNVLTTGEVVVIDVKKTQQVIKGQAKDKIVFECKHPDREQTIEISKVKYEVDGKLEIYGTWLSLDEDKKINKKSALAALMNHYQIKKLNEFIGKKVKTAYNDEKYLVIKAYD